VIASAAFGPPPDVKLPLTNGSIFKVSRNSYLADLSGSEGVSLRAGLSAKLKPLRVFTHPGVHP
jgi:hypothetical protein